MTFKTSSALLFCAAALACSSSNKEGTDLSKPITGAEASNAAKAYEKGVVERGHQNFADAIRYFEYVKNNFPYSQYAALSELAVADMSFDHDDWINAGNQYAEFVKSHPSHPQAPYAAYRIGLAHYNDRASDWFLLPPSYEKDQAPLRAALDAYTRFLATYPKSELVPKAQIEQTDCRERLVAHDRYVARFYEKKKEWRGAANRYLAIADSFGDLREGHLRADALWSAAEDFRKGEDLADQRATLVRFVQDAPTDSRRGQADAMIQTIPADAVPPPLKPVPIPGIEPYRLVEKPITPAETPGAPAERPASAPPPGEPAGQALQPAAPEAHPKPAGPTNQPEKPPEQPTSQPNTPPLAQPDK